jgi:2-dehydro-3-deoxygluconokinase
VVTFGEPLMAGLPEEPLPMEQSPALRLHAGGAELNFAVGMRRLGIASTLVGHVGDDPPGRLIRQILQGEGVDTSRLTVRPRPTGLYLREWLPDGARRPYYYRTGSAAASFGPADWPTDWPAGQAGEGPRWLHLTGVTAALSASCLDACATALDWARSAGIPVSFDPNYRPWLWDIGTARDALRPLIAGCDVLLIGLDEAALLLGADTVAEAAAAAAALGPETVVIKQGAAGASAWRDGRLISEPALATTATDPVGAGDAFNAGCVAALLAGRPLEQALTLGAYCGAKVAAVPGEHAGFPHHADLPQPLRLDG